MPTQPSDWPAWLALREIRGVGPIVYQGLLRAFGTPQAVFSAEVDALECAGLRPEVAHCIRQFKDWQSIDEQLARLNQCCATLITWNDAAYPARLRHIHDPPPFLFCRGALHAADSLAVAVVGSRHVSAYGLRMARELTEGLISYGVTIVSGLARGTDAAAHWAAIRGGGRTIAVLGSGIDVIYPGEHRSLAQMVVSHGAVLSEFVPGTQPDAENFPGRNRIISGMSLGTLVIEAAEKSGSLITAFFAAEQGRDVFAVPGPVGERSRGTHRLIRQGAKLTERAEDILEELAPQILGSRAPEQLSFQGQRKVSWTQAPSVVKMSSALAPDEAQVLELIGVEPLHVDVLIERSGLPAARVLQILLQLELHGAVEQLPGKCFSATGAAPRP